MDALGTELSRTIPFDKHAERIARPRCERAIFLPRTINRTHNVGPAINGQINRAALEAIDLAPLGIKAPEMSLKACHRLAKHLQQIRRRLTANARADDRLCGENGQRRATVRAVRPPVPILQYEIGRAHV